jgi:Na+/melibiose symporter-like transporter
MTKQELSVGLGFFAIFFATQSIATMAVPYYHMVLGVDPFLLGATLTLPILISAVFNPWLGKLFDVNPLLQNRSWVVNRFTLWCGVDGSCELGREFYTSFLICCPNAVFP